MEEKKTGISSSAGTSSCMELSKSKTRRGLQVEGYQVEGISIGGQETCIIFPALKLAFDIGRCPQRAISQDFLFISHGHMDHIVSTLLLILFVFLFMHD
jgi:ribonuclease Z